MSKTNIAPRRFTLDQTVLMKIKDYCENFNNNYYELSLWQREEQPVWEKHGYRAELIISVMDGIDIPKIYIANIRGYGLKIIDGGHRSRAFQGFMNNEYPIQIGDESVFYSSVKRTLKNHRVMTADEKAHFDAFELTVVTYKDISEHDARKIFNRLQNTAPMAMPDIVNSWESPLVDFLRSMKCLEIDDIPLEEHFRKIKGLPKPDNNEYLYQCLSWFTIINPEETDLTQCDNAMRYLEKGKTRDSPCFEYLRGFPSEEVTDEMKRRFRDGVMFLIRHLKEHPMPSADQASFLHSYHWIREFSVEKFNKFSDDVIKFQKKKSESEKCFREGHRETAITLGGEKDQLNAQYHGHLSDWVHSRTNGGSSVKGMENRMAMVKEHCLDEEPGEIFVPNVGVPIPKAHGFGIQSEKGDDLDEYDDFEYQGVLYQVRGKVLYTVNWDEIGTVEGQVAIFKDEEARQAHDVNTRKVGSRA